jgi:hypothetical protein
MARFNRTNFFPHNVVNDIVECDLPLNYFNTLFTIRKELKYYTIRSSDVQRPDILSYKFYGTDEYWWILLKINNIEDVWNDFYVGQVISVPDKQDIDDFYLAVKSKNKQS